MGWQDAPIVERKPAWQSAPVAGGADREARRKEAVYKRDGGAFNGITNRAVDMMTFGLADDAAGVGSVVSNAITAPFSKNVDFDPAAAFARGKGDFQYSVERSKQEAPIASAVGAGLGFAGSIASAGARALRAAPTLSQVVRTGVRHGAVYGAIGGVGASDGDVGERAASAGVGATVGAGLGAALPIAGRLAARTVQGINRIAGRGPSVAPQVIGDAIRADGHTPRAAGQMIDEARARGVPLALADTGDNARALAASVGRQPGPSRTIVRDMAIARQEGQADRIAGAVARDLGPVANPRRASEELQQQARTAAAPLYERAYAAPMAETDGLKAVLSRIPPAAVENAKRLAKLEGRSPTQLGVDLNDAGEVVLTQKPTLQTLDYIKRGLDDVVEKYRDKTTGRLQLDTEGRAVNGVLREYVGELDRLNPAYTAARAAYAGPTRAAAALSKGGSFANKTADDIVAETERMTPFELDQYRLGVRAAMTRQLEAKGDYADKVRTLVGTPKKRMALNQLFGGGREFDRFLRTLGDESRAAHTYNAVSGNSLTASRLADDAATGDGGLISAASNAVVNVAGGGGIVSTLINATREASRYGQGEAGKVARAEIAAALSETDPAVLRAALRQATRSQAAIRAGNRTSGLSAATQGRAAGQIGSQATGYAARLVQGRDR